MEGKKLKSLHVSTYNLENGEIVKTGLTEKEMFDENPKDEVRKLKIAFPNVKTGSILEVEYTVNSGSGNLRNWYFQRQIPVLHSSYSATIPNNWNFSTTLQNTKLPDGKTQRFPGQKYLFLEIRI